MPVYAYEAINKQGAVLTGKLEADQEQMAAERLRGMGFTVMELKQERVSSFKGLFSLSRKISLGELGLFSRQLAAMLEAGIPLTRALFTLSEQVTNPTFAAAVKEIVGKVEGGMSFTESVKSYPNIFSSLYVGMIKAGEVGGNLGSTLERLSDQMQKDKELRDNIRSATMYPIVVGAFAILVLVGMMFFLVPVFMGFFPEDAVLPLPTRIIIFISESLQNYWYLFILALLAAFFALRAYLNSPRGRDGWDKLKFRLPVFGPLVQKAVIARFSRTLSTLLAGGIPIMQALETAGATANNTLVAQTVKEASNKIQEGKSISVPLKESGIFPPMVTHMVAVGEETGALPALLTRVAEFFEEEVATLTRGLTSLLEPVMLVFVGIVVGGMLIALYLPIFTVITQIGG